MKIYIIESYDIAQQLAQLIKINSECVKLHWSRTIKNIPKDVNKALEIIEDFVEAKIHMYCTSKDIFGELSDYEEKTLISVIRDNPGLRATLGNGVVLSGKQAENVRREIEGCNIPQIVIDAINTNKNVIIF